MSYTGKVRPGGPSDVRVMDDLVVRKVSVGDLDNCCYLLSCPVTGEQLLIDAADDAPRLLALIAEGTGALTSVLTTHRHWDHHRGLADIVAATGARTLAGVNDADYIPVTTDRRLHHGDTVAVGQVQFAVIELRGHTPGSIALAGQAGGRTHLFSGDSLFPGGVGNTQGDADRFTQLITDVEQRVFDVYDDRTWVYPGHGADTTLGAERASLPEWHARGW